MAEGIKLVAVVADNPYFPEIQKDRIIIRAVGPSERSRLPFVAKEEGRNQILELQKAYQIKCGLCLKCEPRIFRAPDDMSLSVVPSTLLLRLTGTGPCPYFADPLLGMGPV